MAFRFVHVFKSTISRAPFYRDDAIRWAQQLATVLRSGQTVMIKGKLCTILKLDHRKGTARQLGHVQLELRDIRTQLKTTERLRPSETVEVAFLQSEQCQVLYQDGSSEVVCINPETYEQTSIPCFIFGEQSKYLTSGMTVTVARYESEPVIGSMPVIVDLKINKISSEVHDGMCVAEMENGLKMKVPSYVQPADVVSVNTMDHRFVRRIKS